MYKIFEYQGLICITNISELQVSIHNTTDLHRGYRGNLHNFTVRTCCKDVVRMFRLTEHTIMHWFRLYVNHQPVMTYMNKLFTSNLQPFVLLKLHCIAMEYNPNQVHRPHLLHTCLSNNTISHVTCSTGSFAD